MTLLGYIEADGLGVPYVPSRTILKPPIQKMSQTSSLVKTSTAARFMSVKWNACTTLYDYTKPATDGYKYLEEID